jgi:hypothetical protein
VLTAAAVIACCASVVSAGAASSAPAFVQQVAAHGLKVTKLTLTPTSNITTGNRLVVLVGVWSGGAATAKSVTDSAGNTYVELLHFKASDKTEMSVWSAPITAGGGTPPAITVTPTARADVGAAVSEYSGLSTAPDASVVDQSAQKSGTTSGAGTVASGATAPTTAAGDLAIGMYVDSGFGTTLTVGAGYVQRSNISGASDMDLLTEDQVQANAGATPSATVGTGANTVWLMATLALRSAGPAPTDPPGAPTGVVAVPGDGSATVSWTPPTDGGGSITSYTVTPYDGSTAQTPTTVDGASPKATVTGLANGTTYTFVVTANNAAGIGPPSSPSNAVTPTATNGGQWSALMSWPMVSIHSILMKNGKVLQFDGWQQPEPTQVWDPSTQTFTNQTAPDSIFCSGVAELPDGRVLVVGGYGGLSTGKIGIVDTSIFDPATSKWTRVADMHNPRWYPDLIELADGRFVAISGNSTDSSTWADHPEVYDPSTNTWTVLSSVSTSQVHEEEYPFSYLVPNGNVFTIGPSEDKSFLLNVSNQTWTQVGGSSGVVNGSSVMYRPGKILYSGGTNTQDSNSPANSTTAVIDLNAQTPTWRQTSPMLHARVYHTLTMLPDGTVLAVGGETTWGQTGSTETTGGVLPSEIWNPDTETWSPAAPLAATRGYHSTAVLMPDGTVLVGGSGHANPGYPGQNSSQIYSPPYLFKGPRPTITSAPGGASYGETIPVSTPDGASISAVNLVSLGADTHQSDMDQHFVPLSFSQTSGGLNVQVPSSGAVAPPGNYMLFIVNSARVPSVASFIHIAQSVTVPDAPSGVTASAGNGSAIVSWTAPSDGGSPITSYTITPYIGSTAQTPTTIPGSPPATQATVNGLTNGTAYTFTVTATNGVGTGAASAPSAAVTPAQSTAPVFVQSKSAHSLGVTTLTVTPGSAITAGNRLLVETGVWNSLGLTVSSVTDSAGNKYVELAHWKASENTEMTIWSAPVTAGGGTQPTITVKPTAKADVGAVMLEYSGVSSVADASVVDQIARGTGTTKTAGSVASGATPGTTAANELALGFYVDSGFGDTLTSGSGWTSRANVSNTPDIELLAEDQTEASAGATPNASIGTGANTVWQVATVVLKSAPPPAGAVATMASAALASTSGALAGTTTVATPRALSLRAVVHCTRSSRSPACRSLRQTRRITAKARSRFFYLALLKRLPSNLFCNHAHSAPWTAWLTGREWL